MEFKAEIEKIWTMKKGMKITLHIDEKHTPQVLKAVHNFNDKPLIVDIRIDEKKQTERLKQITPEQRAFIYAIFEDIAQYSGNDKESIKEHLKQIFIQNSQYQDFSLANCSKELATDFLEYLVNFCFEQGVPLSENPKDKFADIEKYLIMCLKHKVCCICGKPAELAHYNAIGMGRDRKTVNDSEYGKMSLCREHHTEQHKIGKDTFNEKYHVKEAIYNE